MAPSAACLRQARRQHPPPRRGPWAYGGAVSVCFYPTASQSLSILLLEVVQKLYIVTTEYSIPFDIMHYRRNGSMTTPFDYTVAFFIFRSDRLTFGGKDYFRPVRSQECPHVSVAGPGQTAEMMLYRTG